ncbi:hypothetical protein M409DRAFT_23029 [Zasmidium cellare ATCC 36951]|uniref:Uncharacterized protein n=1 Tax=Zasmidium cellare ATCC 36951 TaxID=1080233 RepID=A0A6A6CIK6_ZASCE|nr:uncharacterized protein M409DRAFT_23029 [Zasmidium cellare ATCC 36951]KAF2166985.1 hypothetical protein M409DRAFT_23029 [Zasmidium cellare ATCC 36951]
MPTLITGLHDSEVRWSKFKNSYMYNDTYYLRRTKFVIYQCATTAVGVCSGMAGQGIHKYNHTATYTESLSPTLSVTTTPIIAVLALNIASAGLIGTIFTPAIFFDLFWPERWEASRIQNAWKYAAATSSLLQLAAAVALTVVMGTGHVDITAGSDAEWELARAVWSDGLYNYDGGLVVATVVLSWIGAVFTVWSTVVMWMAYWHNNKYGPFNNHIAKRNESSGVVTEESELARTV